MCYLANIFTYLNKERRTSEAEKETNGKTWDPGGDIFVFY